MNTFAFAETQTLFPLPERLFPDSKRATLLGHIMEMVQINCVDNEGWDGMTKHFPVVTGLMPVEDIKQVFNQAGIWCDALGVRLSAISHGGGTWLVGVANTELIPA